jgi:hypothetical protein
MIINTLILFYFNLISFLLLKFLITKKDYIWKVKYVYIIYWHIILLNFVSTIYIWPINLKDDIYFKNKILTVWFLILILPWLFSYLKNIILVKFFNTKLNIFTEMMLDFIKLPLFYIYFFLFSILIVSIINFLKDKIIIFF